MISEPPLPALVRGLQFLFFTRGGLATLLIFLSALFAFVGVVSSLSYNGFCFGERRFLSAEEYVNATIDKIIRSPTYQQVVDFPGFTRFASLKVIPYKSIDEF